MRHIFGFLCVCALGLMPLVGCAETAGEDVLDCQGLEDGTACTVPGVGEGICLGDECKARQCDTDEDCDDKNDCTQDECSTTIVECINEPVSDGTTCAGGSCESGMCELAGSVLPCTEQGIRNAIAAGGGPYTFDCGGPKTVVTEAEIVIDNNVTLDGEGNLTVDADFTEEGNFRYSHTLFSVAEGMTAELIGLKMTEGGFDEPCSVGDVCNGPGMTNYGTLALTNVELLKNMAGIDNLGGTLTLTNTTLNDGGVYSTGTLTLTNSTVSSGVNVNNDAEGMLTITNSTIFGEVFSREAGTATLTQSLVVGECGCIQANESCEFSSGGYNIESPGNTCGFDQEGDQPSVPDPMLGPLQNNGGLTETHALLPGSPAINRIPEAACEAETDQRGEPRPETGGTMCDVGAFEVQQ